MPTPTKAPPKAAETPTERLTLQQKFVKLREAIPAITQQAHSDGVKYKFAKIFDVYKLLTPAMNAHGVNFDIVKEEATRHSENGDAVYYHSYQQNTRNGVRTVWVYEADLTIRWTNADKADDVLEVTLHAIGTNDGGPDKAKGSAWTYCLKYYLFEKFGIDQGDDDPDMNDLSGETQTPQYQNNAQKGAKTPQKGAGYESNRPKAQNAQNRDTGTQRALSDAQLDRMNKKAEAAGVSQASLAGWIEQKYGQKDPRLLTREQYDETCQALDVQAQQKQGGNANV